MEHYVTLFDSLFLPQGIALHASLERHAGSYKLWVLCVDERAHEVLSKMALPNMRLLRLADWETPELLRVKPGRTRGEYCWTLTPFAPKFVFDADASVGRVTYLDADVWFCGDAAKPLLELEQSGKTVLITEHAYAPEYDYEATAGRFCVQFMTFVRQHCETVRAWWAERCIEWCFARYEDGKFGDQRYLDDWPQRFPEHVHVLQHKALLQAPWNAVRFNVNDAVMYHFHGLRLLRNQQLWFVEGYKIPEVTIRSIYHHYAEDFSRALTHLREVGHIAQPQSSKPLWQLQLREMGRRITAPRRFSLVPMSVAV